GWPVRAVEQGEFEVVFVVEPGILEAMSSFGLSTQSKPLASAEQIRAIVANDSITAFMLHDAATTDKTRTLAPSLSQYGSRAPLRLSPQNPVGSWIRGLYLAPSSVPPTHRLRTADAVAAAAYYLGGSSRRRAVVLIAGVSRPAESTFAPEQARVYLGQPLVPLFVWRKDPKTAPEWGGGGDEPLFATFGHNIADLRRQLDRQRIVWLEGHVDPRNFNPKLPPGITIAGRADSGSSPAAREPARKPALDGPIAVFAVTVDPATPGTVYAGTRGGLQASRDGGEHWSKAKTGTDPGEVYSVAFPGDSREIFFGSSGAIGRSIAGGESWAMAPTLAVFSILPSSKETAFAATRGGVYRTADGGTRWL